MTHRVSFLATVTGLLLSPLAHGQERDTGVDSSDRDDDDGPGGTRFAIEADYATELGETAVGDGFGGALRLGHEYDLVLLSLTPELAGSLHKFSGTGDPLAWGAMAGGRAAIGKVIEPGVFAHVGVGHGSLPVDSVTGLALDLGASLDFTLLPLIDLGVHAAYDTITWNGDSLDWFRLGAHLAFAP